MGLELKDPVLPVLILVGLPQNWRNVVKEFSFRTSIKLSELEIALKAECNLRDRHKPNSTLPTALMAFTRSVALSPPPPKFSQI